MILGLWLWLSLFFFFYPTFCYNKWTDFTVNNINFNQKLMLALQYFTYIHESISISPICASMRVDIPLQDVRTNNLPVPNPCVVIAIFTTSITLVVKQKPGFETIRWPSKSIVQNKTPTSKWLRYLRTSLIT